MQTPPPPPDNLERIQSLSSSTESSHTRLIVVSNRLSVTLNRSPSGQWDYHKFCGDLVTTMCVEESDAGKDVGHEMEPVGALCKALSLWKTDAARLCFM